MRVWCAFDYSMRVALTRKRGRSAQRNTIFLGRFRGDGGLGNTRVAAHKCMTLEHQVNVFCVDRRRILSSIDDVSRRSTACVALRAIIVMLGSGRRRSRPVCLGNCGIRQDGRVNCLCEVCPWIGRGCMCRRNQDSHGDLWSDDVTDLVRQPREIQLMGLWFYL